MAASVSTRVVSWNDAAEMNESVDSEALVMPSSIGRPRAGMAPCPITRSFPSRAARRHAAVPDHPLVLVEEAEAIDHVVDQELRVADVLDAHPAHHLADDH